MTNINIIDMRGELTSIAYDLYEKIIEVPQEIRGDTKERTGMKIMVRGATPRNLILLDIHEPSEAAQFFAIEKAVRSEILRQPTSQNSEDEVLCKFPGSITVTPETGVHYQVSCSGLMSHEDVAVDLVLMAKVLGWSVSAVISNIRAKGGLLPLCFENSSHYLQPIIGY